MLRVFKFEIGEPRISSQERPVSCHSLGSPTHRAVDPFRGNQHNPFQAILFRNGKDLVTQSLAVGNFDKLVVGTNNELHDPSIIANPP